MLPLRIALRYLFSRKSHNAVNIISIVAVAGVTVATLATVCVLSVFNGFAGLASGRLSLIDPELKALPVEGKVIGGADSIASALVSGPTSRYVAAAVPTLEEQALVIRGEAQMPVTLKGVADGYEEVCSVDSAVIDGVFAVEDPYGYPAMALSVGAAIELGARPDAYNPVAVYAPRRRGRISAANAMNSFRTDSMLVAGVWQVEQAEYDAAFAITGIERARRLFDYTSGEASAIEIAVRPSESLAEARKAIAAALGPQWRVLTREEQQTASFRMIAVEKWITFLMLAFIVLIASFNVVSTLTMLIIEKRDNMATLRAMGATPHTTSAIFFWEGWLISVLGGAAGIVIGVALCLAQQYLGWIRLNGDPTKLTVSAYPVEVHIGDLVVVALLVVLVGTLVGAIAGRLSRR
ncbi:MAG: FtsX-like permease family protein [Paramuribaculum sp.]|nr:FtsX-like permease family protein [Paramuribaculum sp.]